MIVFVISRHAEGPGQEILQRPRLSVRLSVCHVFHFRTVTRKRIAVISQNFAGMCTMSWGCVVWFLILMGSC